MVAGQGEQLAEDAADLPARARCVQAGDPDFELSRRNPIDASGAEARLNLGTRPGDAVTAAALAGAKHTVIGDQLGHGW